MVMYIREICTYMYFFLLKDCLVQVLLYKYFVNKKLEFKVGIYLYHLPC